MKDDFELRMAQDMSAALERRVDRLLAALDKLVAVVPVEYDYHGKPVDLELARALDEAEKLIAELKG
jgi:hypothetical protein